MFFNVYSMVYVKLTFINSVVWNEFLEMFFSHVVNVGCLKVKLFVLIWSYFFIKIVPVHTMKTRGRGLASLILNLGTRWLWVVISWHWMIYSWGKSHQYPFSRGWVGSRAGLHSSYYCQNPEFLGWLSCRVTVLSVLPWVLLLKCIY